MHIDTIKLRTRCARCGCIGHWARECTNEPDARGRQKQQENVTNKAGFCEVRAEETTNTHDSFWGSQPLRVPTFGQCLPPRDRGFHGITTHREHAVVDTAAQGGLIGKAALNRLESVLRSVGLRIRWMDKVAQARGIGGEASVCGVVEIPIAVAGVNGIVEATVVEEDVPLLLSIRFLREVHAVVDIADGRLHLNKFGTSTSLHDLPSGHVAVSIVDFPEEGWSAPHEAVVQHRNTRDFELLVCGPAMSGTSFATNNAPVEHLPGRHGPLQATERDEASGGGRRYGVPPNSSQARSAQLDSGAKESVGADRAVRSTGAGRKLARRWIVLWLASSMFTPTTALGQCVEIHRQCDRCWLQGEGVQGADFGGRPLGSSQVQEPPRARGQDVLPSCREANGKWQSESARGVVHTMPSEVAGRSPSDDGSGSQEDRGASRGQGVESGAIEGRDTGGREELGEDVENSNQWRICEATGYSPQNTRLYGNTTDDSTKIANEAGRSAMLLRSAGGEVDGEEGDGQKGKALLQVSSKSVRFLPMGSKGSEGHPAEGESTSYEASSRGRGVGDPSSRGATSDWQHDGGSREASYSDDGGSTPSVPISAGPVTQSVSVDDGSGWRGEVGKDHERSSAAGRNESQGSGAEAELGRDGEASSGQLRRRWQQHVDMEKIEEAPWACVLENRAQWEKWRMMQRKSEDLRSYERQAAYGGWTKRENGGWVAYKGILPNYEPGSRAIGVFYEGGAWMADEEYEEASKSLSRSSRRAVQKRMRQMVVAEVYSNPRVAKEAVEMGHRSGGSYDLGTGYDFSKASERRRCWKELEAQDPDLLVLCPPCGPFSLLQELNYGKMEFSKAVMKVAEGVEHVKFAMRLYAWQHLRGKSAIFEHPSTFRAWQEESVQEVMSLEGVRRVRADQCRYGLQVRGIPNKKPTDFLVNGSHTSAMLSRRCRGDQPLTEGRAALAQTYPKKLCQAMVRGAEKDSVAWKWCSWATEQDVQEDEDVDLEDALERERERGAPSTSRSCTAATRGWGWRRWRARWGERSE